MSGQFRWSFPGIFTGILLVISGGFLTARQPSAGDLLDQVRTRLTRALPLSAGFTQQLVYEGRVELEEKGRMILKSPHLIKWEYREPEYKVFLLKGEEYFFYDREFMQLTIGSIRDKKQQWIWQLLFSDDIRDHCRSDVPNRLLIIHDPGQGIDIRVQLTAGLLPQTVTQQEEGGYRRVLIFRDFEERVRLPEKEFELNVPPGTEVINLD